MAPTGVHPDARPERSRRTSPGENSSPEPRAEVKRGSTNKSVDIHLDRIEARIQELVRQSEEQNSAVTRRRKGRKKRRQRHEDEVIQRARRFSEVVITGQLTRSVEGAGFRPTDVFNPVQAFEDFASFKSHLPVELLQEIAWQPFIYSFHHMYLPARIHESMSTMLSDNSVYNWEYQELLHTYFHITADRLADTSPCYMDIWRSYIPAMAFGGADGSKGLLNAIITFAAVHVLPLQMDRARGYRRIRLYYGAALSACQSGSVYDDARLATMLLLAHIELWRGEITTMGLHMVAAMNAIVTRGREASQTPIGRALFSFWLRSDCGSSVTTGNPVFLDEQWWQVDPLYHITIAHDAPLLLAADAATSKLTFIIAKLTVLKRYAQECRKNALAKAQKKSQRPDFVPGVYFAHIEAKIRRKVDAMQLELEAWHRSLPTWFGPLNFDQMAVGEEDINQTTIREIVPYRYPHYTIAAVYINAFAAHIQLWRVVRPDDYYVPPRIGAIVHGLLRAFASTPMSCDSITIQNVWIAAILLQQQCHRDWVLQEAKRRIRATDFYGWKFALHGILFGWTLRDGAEPGRFKSIPDGAQEIVPGVSQNLWRADGIMNLHSSLVLNEGDVQFDNGERMYRFQGDTRIFNDPEDEADGAEQLEGVAGPPSPLVFTPEPGAPDEVETDRKISLYQSFIDDY